MSAATHIAGMAILLGRHGRQRCAWCGAMLFEITGDDMGPCKEDGSPPDPLKPWSEGALVEMATDGACTTYRYVGDGKNEDEDLPVNSCVWPQKLRVLPGGAP
jgi:hypothetical protein